MATDCLFCKIINGDLPANIRFENDDILAFDDIEPSAPTHILIIPKKHFSTLNDLETTDSHIVGDMVLVAKQLAADLGFAEAGYRLIMNCNKEGGQTVFHIHLHLLGGRDLTWPPG